MTRQAELRSTPGDIAAGPSATQEWRRNWQLVLAATAGMSLAALSTSSFGVMVMPIQQDLHWSRTAIASGPTVITLVVFSLSTLFGNAVDRFGARRIGVAAVLTICGALALMSRIGSHIWAWWAIWGLVGLGSAVMPAVWLKPVSSRFVAGRGMALAVVLCGTGLSAFLVPSLTNRLVEAYGWRVAYLGLAAIWCTVVLPLVLLFLQGAPNGHADAQGQGGDDLLPGLSVSEGFRSRKFHRLLLGSLLSTFLGTALVLNLVPVLRSTGLAATSAASIAGLMGLSIVGRFASGWLLDRINGGLLAGLAVISMVLLPLALLLMPGSIPAAMLGVASYAVMGGALLPSAAYLVSRHLGPRRFGTFYGTINATHSIGVGLGPLLANYLFDQTGSYRLTIMAAIPMFGLGAILLMSLGRYPTFSTPAAED